MNTNDWSMWPPLPSPTHGAKRALAAAMAWVSFGALGQPASFTGLTDPFPGTYVSDVFGVSADGKVVVGMTYKPTSPDFGNRSFRWRASIGYDNPGPSQGITQSHATGVSADGNVIVGSTGHAAFGDEEAWVRVGASTGHVGSPPGANFSHLLGVSGDGRFALGFGGDQSNPNSARAAYYNTETDQWVNIGFLPGGTWSKAYAASADGSVIVGASNSASNSARSAFRRVAGQMLPVPGMPAGWTQNTATAVSADGVVIVGYDENGQTTSWRWSQADGLVVLGPLRWATGVSPDGKVVVGIEQASGSNEPFIWDQAHGVRNLRTVLESFGLSSAMQGWYLGGAQAVSQSGSVYAIAGFGGDPTDHIAGWVATLPGLDAPCYADCDESGQLAIDDFICFQTLFAISSPGADCDASGKLDIDDFICFQTMFAIGC